MRVIKQMNRLNQIDKLIPEPPNIWDTAPRVAGLPCAHMMANHIECLISNGPRFNCRIGSSSDRRADPYNSTCPIISIWAITFKYRLQA